MTQPEKKHAPMKPRPYGMGRIIFYFLLAVATMIVAWYYTFSPESWVGIANYLAMYFDFMVRYPVEAFFTLSTGPGRGVSWLIIVVYLMLAAHIYFYFEGKSKNFRVTIINKYYLAYLICLGLFTVTFQNAAQYYGWYYNPATGTPGYVDTWTHIVSPWFIGAFAVPFAMERYPRWQRKYFWVPVVILVTLTALGWELAENVDLLMRPGVYFNYPMESLKDIVMGTTVAPLISTWIYQRMVMDMD